MRTETGSKLCTLKTKAGAVSQGMRQSLEAGKCKENGFSPTPPLESPGKKHLCQHPDFSPIKSGSNFEPQKY